MYTNTQLLEEKIERSGLKVAFIISNLGISDTAWYKKKSGKIPFRVAEMKVICYLLHLTDDEAEDIFFSKGSVKTER